MNSGTITNAGDIEIGTLSQGIYAQNSGDVLNNGKITSVSVMTACIKLWII